MLGRTFHASQLDKAHLVLIFLRNIFYFKVFLHLANGIYGNLTSIKSGFFHYSLQWSKSSGAVSWEAGIPCCWSRLAEQPHASSPPPSSCWERGFQSGHLPSAPDPCASLAQTCFSQACLCCPPRGFVGGRATEHCPFPTGFGHLAWRWRGILRELCLHGGSSQPHDSRGGSLFFSSLFLQDWHGLLPPAGDREMGAEHNWHQLEPPTRQVKKCLGPGWCQPKWMTPAWLTASSRRNPAYSQPVSRAFQLLAIVKDWNLTWWLRAWLCCDGAAWRAPNLSVRGTTFSLVPFLCCPPGLSWHWDVGRMCQLGHSQVAAETERGQLCTALLSTSAARQCQWDMAGETQAEDGAISHSHRETGHGFPLPQTGWEQCCWLRLAPFLPWSTLDKSHPCFLPQSLVCKVDANTSQGCCET